MLAVPSRGWQRVGVAALLTVPFILVVISIMPVLLVSTFLDGARRQYMLRLMDHMIGWARVIAHADLSAAPSAGTAIRHTDDDSSTRIDA